MVPKTLSSRSVPAFGQRKRYLQVKFAWPWNADLNFVESYNLLIETFLTYSAVSPMSPHSRNLTLGSIRRFQKIRTGKAAKIKSTNAEYADACLSMVIRECVSA